ncbi:MAG TPA: selenocysteine-specific translation elongation factor [Terriglobales bacterium]|nr:selenocysteine-specific translation elongation factor [Terriglobales bacterium]
MKSIIIGTAGHIDHGKTALVKALTGIDADRLEEEKRRGITIDLGFAHLELSAENGENLRLGFVDVPGHERFVRNMLAGVGGIDLVLLVIAADEGIKPQTREHFDICRLLGIQHGVVVLTKSDLVDSETLEVVRLEIEDYLRGSFLENAPIIPVSSLSRTGLEELKQALGRLAGQISARDSSAITRLPIDRVFTMKGFGTVVTGTLLAGAVRKEDELQLFPSGKKVRIRGVQVHGKIEDRAVAGERTALNLAGVEKQELERGMVLASPGLLQTSSRLDVQLSLLPSAKALKNAARVHFHAFASETVATVQLHESTPLKPGTTAFAQLRLASPVLLIPGDRFIIRQFSPVVTIGGGIVLDSVPVKMPVDRRIQFLKELSAAPFDARLLARISRNGQDGVTLAQFIAETGRTREQLLSHTSKLASDRTIVKHGELLISAQDFQNALATLCRLVSEFHKRDPLKSGLSKEELRDQSRLSSEVFAGALDDAIKNRTLALTGDLVHLPGRSVVLKDEESESRKTIEQAFASAGLKVPALKDVLAGLKIDRTRAQKIVTLLLREKTLVKVSDDLVFHQSALADLRKAIATHKTRSTKIDVGGFKDLTGVSRKYAIPLLEYLDRERITRREGNLRTIL